MGAEDVHIREHPLPGVGSRFDLDLEDDKVLSVVARRDGSRDVAVRDRRADQAERSVHLARHQAVAVGSLLLGARFSEGGDDPHDCTIDIGTVVLAATSPAIGAVAADVALPGGAEAAIVAVVRDDTPQLLEDPQRPCRAGDRLVVAARREWLDDVITHLAG